MDIMKKLNMNYPKITCYNQHANLLSIISENDDYLPWLYNYYIQLQFANNINHPEIGARLDFENLFEWESCPFLYFQKINRKLIQSGWGTITDFIIECIDQGYYLYFTVDSFYIDIYDTYQRAHFIHPLLIYGYNQDERLFYVADNCHDGKYSYETVSFEQLTQGYDEAVKYDEEFYLDGVNLVQRQKRERFYNWYHTYEFDLNLVKSSIEDYLSSTGLVEHGMVPLEQWKRDTLVYGMTCYQYILNYLKNLDQYHYDIRTFFVLFEHKKIMAERIKYMMDYHYLKEDIDLIKRFETIRASSEMLHNSWLKYGITGKTTTLNKITEQLKQLGELEEESMKKVLDCLK